MYVVARARSEEKTRLTGKYQRLVRISPSSRDASLYSCDNFVEKRAGWRVGSLSRRIVLLFNGNGCVETGLGRIIEHDVHSSLCKYEAWKKCWDLYIARVMYLSRPSLRGAGGEACSQAAAPYLQLRCRRSRLGVVGRIGSNLAHDSCR